jgi:diadenosine tetraphosphate (Ap4A) HIT family hydrolase
MNPTIEKFGYPATLLCDLEYWVILLRPAQVTLGSLVLAAKSDATAFAQLPPEAFAELHDAVGRVERALKAFTKYQRINYLMLMMVDPNVHFHVIPRYEGQRVWRGEVFADAGWPGPPALGQAIALSPAQIADMAKELTAII